MPALLLFSIYWLACNVIPVVAAFTTAMGFLGFSYAGFEGNNLDLAPNYAGILFGIASTFSTLCGIIAPSAVGVIVQKQVKFGFLICALCMCGSGILVIAV